MRMSFAIAAIAALAAAAGTGAQAQVTRGLNMTFASGATFNGTVTFANDYSSVLDVTGTLHGYTTFGFDGVSDDTIDWVWASGANFSSGSGNYSTFLMDGPGSGYNSFGGYSNWIQLAYNYSSAPTLLFTSGVSVNGTDNFVDYSDPMVGGSFSDNGAVPEPASWAMMLGGFGLVGGAMRSRRKAAVTFA